MKIKKQFVSDNHGNIIGIFLTIEDFMKLKNLAERSENISDAEDIHEEEVSTEELNLDNIMKQIEENPD